MSILSCTTAVHFISDKDQQTAILIFSCCCSRSPLLFSLWNLYPKKGCESTDDDDHVVNFVKNPCWVTLVLPSSVCPVNAFFISSFECFFVLLWLSCRDRHESTTDWLTHWSWIRVTFWVTLCHDDDVVRTTPVSLYVWCSRWWWRWWGWGYKMITSVFSLQDNVFSLI